MLSVLDAPRFALAQLFDGDAPIDAGVDSSPVRPVAPVDHIPDSVTTQEPVGPGTAKHRVTPLSTDQAVALSAGLERVGASPAEKPVGPAPAQQEVVSPQAPEHVVATEAADHVSLARPDEGVVPVSTGNGALALGRGRHVVG